MTILTDQSKIYFSSDGGYGNILKKLVINIPFDLTRIDSGQYNKAWQHSHMFQRISPGNY